MRHCHFFKQFYKLTVKVPGTSFTTTNTSLDNICIVYCTLCDWQRIPDVDIKLMAKRMKEKFDKYRGNFEKMNSLLYIASVLDPRKKLDFVEWCLMKMYSPDQASMMTKNFEKRNGRVA